MSYDGLGCFFYSNPDRLCPTQAERDAEKMLFYMIHHFQIP